MSPLWRDSGTWIAIGVSVLTLAMAVAMRWVFVKILRAPPPDDEREEETDHE
jgi:hypothetical protein